MTKINPLHEGLFIFVFTLNEANISLLFRQRASSELDFGLCTGFHFQFPVCILISKFPGYIM